MSRKIQFVWLILTFFVCSFAFAQSDSTRTHIVEQGQTAYSIANFYKIDVKELRKYNPSLDESYSLQLGQKLLIPVSNIKKPVFVTQNKIHQVKPSETLYSISKKYNLPVDSLKKWNNLSSNSIFLNQKLIIGEEQVEVKPTVVEKKIIRTAAKTHVVKEKETLYSLSKAYNVPVDSILSWNKLKDNDIQINQNLIVGWEEKDVSISAPEPPKPVVTPVASPTPAKPDPVRTSQPVKTSYQNKQSVLQRHYRTQNNSKNTEGVGIWFQTENAMMNTTYYGLFNNAKVGTVIKVTNLMNNRSVYVKVIGNLPDTGENAGATVKLTPACKSILQNNDGKFRVRITYE